MDKLGLTHSLLVAASNEIPHRDYDAVKAFRTRARMVIRKIWDDSSPYLKELDAIQFHPMAWSSGMPDSINERAWTSGHKALVNLCKTMLEDVQMSHMAEITPGPAITTTPKTPSSRVFVVHGHDAEMKQAVARTLEKLGLSPIILHEHADKGRTVIEKFLDYSDVGFAVVLLSPDDLGCEKAKHPDGAKPRARQNVILELGFFLGKLGRQHVLALHRQLPDFDMPSDYGGVLFKPYDSTGTWKFELAKELKACGYTIDANALL